MVGLPKTHEKVYLRDEKYMSNGGIYIETICKLYYHSTFEGVDIFL